MATFSLSELRAEVERKYAPTIVENGSDRFELQNLLQLPEKRRDQVIELVESIEEDTEEGHNLTEQLKVFEKIVVFTERNGRGQELLDLLGDNTAMVFELVTKWLEASQVGEA